MLMQDERGFAFQVSNERKQGSTLQILTVINVLLNTVFALAATYLLSKYHRDLSEVKGKRYNVVASMYWAVVIMCFVGCVVVLLVLCTGHIWCMDSRCLCIPHCK